MTAAILFAIGTMFSLIALWPFGPYQFSLAVARRLHRFPPPLEPAGEFSVQGGDRFAICLCAYNEASVIGDKVEDLLRLREAAGQDLDILIYVDAATDATASILASYGDRIRLVVGSDRRGKTHGMNLLVAQTQASIVMFTDANVRIDPSAVAVLRRYFADPSIGCVCSHLSYVNGNRSATASVGNAFWSFNEWSKGLETATGAVIGADGSLFAIRRQLHRPVPKGLFDDLFVSLGVLFAGYRVVRAPELRAYETHATTAADEFRRKVRIACECMHVHFELWPQLRRTRQLESLQIYWPPPDALDWRLFSGRSGGCLRCCASFCGRTYHGAAHRCLVPSFVHDRVASATRARAEIVQHNARVRGQRCRRLVRIPR